MIISERLLILKANIFYYGFKSTSILYIEGVTLSTSSNGGVYTFYIVA